MSKPGKSRKLEQRLQRLADRGVLHQPPGQGVLAPVERRPGALKRFLDEREGEGEGEG